MRKIAVMLLVLLGGCDASSTPTPLSRAVAALRDGDREAFAKAKADADIEVKTAIQRGGDLCRTTVADVIKHHAVHAIRKMDHADLFKLPEEDRLAFAMHIAGGGERVWPESFLTGAPDFYQTQENADLCKDRKENWMAMQLDHASYSMNEDGARKAVFLPWIEEVKSRHGDQYEAQMRSAVQHLSVNGYSAKWPPQLDLD